MYFNVRILMWLVKHLNTQRFIMIFNIPPYMKMRFNGHVIYDSIAFRTNVAFESSSGIGNSTPPLM